MKDAPEYVDAASRGRSVARVGGRKVEIDIGRVRSYPGLAGEAPDTRAYYALATEKLSGAARVLDVGTGSGAGALVLKAAFAEVVAIDEAREAVAFARAHAGGVMVVHADGAAAPASVTADAAVLVDVLGHARDPRALLRAVHARLRPGGRVVVAEARAYPTQALRAPARRAFSSRALASLLEAMGFDVDEEIGGPGPFVAFVAHAAAGNDPDAIVRAACKFGEGDVDGALRLLDEAAATARVAVRMDALVTLGDVRMALGDGDGAAKALLAARAVDPKDPRPVAGLARLTLAMGDRVEAAALARIATSLDPACSAAACALAMTIGAPGDKDNAALRIAAALSPDDEAVAMAFAESSRGAGARKAAVFALERARRYGDPLPVTFHVLLADLLLEECRREDAILEARLAEAVSPGAPEVAALWSRVHGGAARA